MLLIKVISGCLKYVEYDLGYFIVFIIKNVFTKSSRYFFFFFKIMLLVLWFDLNEQLKLCPYNDHFTCETQIAC